MTVRAILKTLHVFRILNLFFLWFFAAYVGFSFIPTRAVWFNPGPVRVLDADSGKIPTIEYSRTIHRDIMVSWNATIRQVANGTGPQGVVYCHVYSDAYRYKAVSGPAVGKDLSWWLNESPACFPLEDGAYWMETCWTLVDPLGDLLPFIPEDALGVFGPKKKVCESTPIFYIGPRPNDRSQNLTLP